MNRIAVSSSNVVSVGYDQETQTLEVEYQRSGLYQYYDVPEHLFSALMEAASVGAFLNANIKHAFRYSRL